MKDGKGLAVMIGLGKPRHEEEEDESDGGSEKELAGMELADALEAKDGTAICEAVRRIMELENYDEE